MSHALVDFLESFSKYLEIYNQVSLTTKMTEEFVKIIIEVIFILSIATNEVKRKKGSESFLQDILCNFRFLYFVRIQKTVEKQRLSGYIGEVTWPDKRGCATHPTSCRIYADPLTSDSHLRNSDMFVIYYHRLLAVTEIRPQGSKKSRRFENGFPRRTRQQTTTSRGRSTVTHRPRGSLKPTYSRTGCQMVHFLDPRETYVFIIFRNTTPDLTICAAGSGKSVLWCVISRPLLPVTVLMLTVSAEIIQHIMALRDNGKVTLGYFYFDFQDEQKKTVRDTVTSLFIQLSAYSKPCHDIIYRLYSTHGKGTQQPSNEILIDCLKEMLTITTQPQPIFIVMDALDECPDDGMPTPREEVLNLVRVLVRLQLPNLHICVTSRPEIGIQILLKPLAVHALSLDDETR